MFTYLERVCDAVLQKQLEMMSDGEILLRVKNRDDLMICAFECSAIYLNSVLKHQVRLGFTVLFCSAASQTGRNVRTL